MLPELLHCSLLSLAEDGSFFVQVSAGEHSLELSSAGSAQLRHIDRSLVTAACCLFLQVIELIKRPPRESPAGDFVPDSGTLQGSLELQGVVFTYPGRPTQQVLNGLSLAVSPGEVVALVGPSGGGKVCGVGLPQERHSGFLSWPGLGRWWPSLAPAGVGRCWQFPAGCCSKGTKTPV